MAGYRTRVPLVGWSVRRLYKVFKKEPSATRPTERDIYRTLSPSTEYKARGIQRGVGVVGCRVESDNSTHFPCFNSLSLLLCYGDS
jgi:hypothetical protein